MKKQYDVEKIKQLYEKYGTLNGVAIRIGCASGTVKKILEENNVEIKKYVAPRWNFKKNLSGF
ncbi:hypothetical protein [Clostridium akagii]|uniref:hypothetical protein n=1 Tax=Clostridium akagii TaxID=91623 RepID=UPI00047BEB9F|nr:hypothetical protein [Clostridium akagii]